MKLIYSSQVPNNINSYKRYSINVYYKQQISSLTSPFYVYFNGGLIGKYDLCSACKIITDIYKKWCK